MKRKNKGAVGERGRLIEAAGRLLALKSDPKLVSVREILALAKVEKARAQSLFKNKGELFEAVYCKISEMYERDPIRKYLESHRGLLCTRRGQALFLSGLVDELNSFFENMRGTWRGALCGLLGRKNPEFMGFNLCRQFECSMASWCEIFEAISGHCDIFEASAKYSGIIMPIALRFFCGEICVFPNSKNLTFGNSRPAFEGKEAYLQHIKESLIADLGLESLYFEYARN